MKRKLYGIHEIIKKLSSEDKGELDIDDIAYSLREAKIISDDAYINYQISQTRGLPKDRKAIRQAGYEVETDSRTELPTLKQKFFSHASRWPGVALAVTYSPLMLVIPFLPKAEMTSTPTQLLTLGGLVAAHSLATGIKPKKNILAQYSRYAMDGLTFGAQRKAYWAAHYDREANKHDQRNNSEKADFFRQKAAALREKFGLNAMISLPYENGIVPIAPSDVSYFARRINNNEVPNAPTAELEP